MHDMMTQHNSRPIRLSFQSTAYTYLSSSPAASVLILGREVEVFGFAGLKCDTNSKR